MTKTEYKEFLGKKAEKPTNASVLFPEIQKDLEANPGIAGSLVG
jgi:hypothetical protein